MSKISVVLNTLNEADTLPRAVASVKNLADEIIVVDMESTDNTREIAKRLGAKVFKHKREAYVERARNFAINKASGEWIFVLDVDEEVPPSLAKEIKKVVNTTKSEYFRIPRKNIIFGHWMKYSRWWPDYNIRLFKKGAVSWNQIIHGVPMTQGSGEDFKAEENLAIKHNHYDSVEQYVVRMNRYTGVQSELKLKEGYKFSWKDLLTKPTNEFLSRYFFGSGYKDGLHGLALSLLQAFSELVLYLKVWQAENFTKDDIKLKSVVDLMREEEKELHYWQSDAIYKESGKFSDRIKRRFRL